MLPSDILQTLIERTRSLGDPQNDFVMMAEGNTSARADSETFFVKASGFGFQDANETHFVQVYFEPVLRALDGQPLSDDQVRRLLREARVPCDHERLPSVETFMHAYLLQLPDVNYVYHTHPSPFVSLMCLEGAEMYADKRLFPDEIAFCGEAACWVGYVDPGLELAKAIRKRVQSFIRERESLPKTIWLQNHGLITLGKTEKEAETAMRMQVKAARILLGALQSGQPLHFLSPEEVQRIHTRPDEHYRQRLLWEAQG